MAKLVLRSDKVIKNPLAQNAAGLERLVIGMRRIRSVLDREQAAGIRTLEMKISDAGPPGLRVEPHILGLAGLELVERGLVKIIQRPASRSQNWYAPSKLKDVVIDKKLDEIVPAYLQTTNAKFTSALGDPLEIGVFKILQRLRKADRKVTFFGKFDLTERRPGGRYRKVEPPTEVCDISLHGLSNGAQSGPPIGVQKGPLDYR